MRLGRLLQLWRRREALTLRAAAGLIGINPSTLARIERGESMHGATLTTLLVWLMGREERGANEAFTFEAEDAVAVKDQVAERNTWDAGEWSSNACQLGGAEVSPVGDETIEPAGETNWCCDETIRPFGAAIEDEQETAAELPVHALDQNLAVCGVRSEQLGGCAHGAAGAGAEGAG